MGGSGNLPIGPGVWGFLALFVLAIALWLLVRNMNSRLRRMAYREHERVEAERAADDAKTKQGLDSTDETDEGPESTEKG
ncbi:MAG TPA: hypothetical protein VIR15_02695 [Intrasporangium sp.]|jgi:hypothetical protein|uniref:hypothetical protein n=1 Tax=Intrasporangium sp. TaxID=1925024 RepID=UPI002F929E5B